MFLCSDRILFIHYEMEYKYTKICNSPYIRSHSIQYFKLYVLEENFIIMSISVIAVVISITFIGFMPITYYFMIILIGLAITLFSILPLYIKLKKLNISNILKKKGVEY